MTLVTASAATWCYLIGESVGGYLGFIQGALALTAGCMIGMLLVLMAAGPPSVRFGIDSIARSAVSRLSASRTGIALVPNAAARAPILSF